MRLTIDLREKTRTTYGPPPSYGDWYARELERLADTPGFTASAGEDTRRWKDLGRRMLRDAFEVSVPGNATVAEARAIAMAEARRRGVSVPSDERIARIRDLAVAEARRRGESASDIRRAGLDVVGTRLSRAEDDEMLPDELSLGEAEVTEGDLLVLHVDRLMSVAAMMVSVPGPPGLVRGLGAGGSATAPDGGPRLWGALLYTDADVELATYVRTHFDDLNALSGPATRVFAVERRVETHVARRYWRRHMEPELYRVLSALRWLRWAPHDPQGAYEVASLLGLGPETLPCLVFFHGLQEPLHEGERIVFRIEATSPAYFRALFGGIGRALASAPDAGGRTPRTGDRGVPDGLLPVTGDLRAVPEAGQAADAAAFARVRAAEAAIRAALVPAAAPPGARTGSSHVVVMSGADVTGNFYFQGANTTFINQPVNTVVKDFQNTYGPAAGADDLARLLRLILSSRDLDDDRREEAARAVHDLARAAAGPEPDAPAARTRLERLRELLTGAGADIAQPALAILASLAAIFAA